VSVPVPDAIETVDNLSEMDESVKQTRLENYLDRAASQWPDHTAVVDSTGQALTYRQLHNLAENVGAFLTARGFGPGDLVGFMMAKRCEAIVLMFGTMKAGAGYVPLDRNAGPGRIRQILGDCGVRVLFTDEDALAQLHAAGLPGHGIATVVIPPAGPGSTTRWADALPPANSADSTGPAPTGDDLAYLLYTSGSTGIPKGVRVSHGNAISFVEWASVQFNITTEDRVAGHAPLHFDLSVFDVFATVRSGAALYLLAEHVAADPRRIPNFLARHHITVWYSAPSILGMIAERTSAVTNNRLRLVLFAGEVFPVAKLRRLTRLWPHPAYYNLYGPTETNVCTFARIPTPVPDDRTEPYPIGHPCSHCAVMVVDEWNRPVPEKQPGLLCVAGPSVVSGYWGIDHDPRFFHHDGRRWYQTGDVVRPSADGFIFCGRRDRMIKRRGYRIELDELEHALARCPDLTDAAVIADTTHPSAIITAFVVTNGAPMTQIGLRSFCRAELGPHLIPDRFVHLDALPRTSTGKIDYQRLQQTCS
jgi:amino acid adenylation domain-containing protein